MSSLIITSSILIQFSSQTQLQESQELQEARSRSIAQSIETKVDNLQEELQYLERVRRSEEHTSELQSRETISYAVFCLKKKKNNDMTVLESGFPT